MDRTLKVTADGSHTMYVKGLDEPYHSVHGAIQESKHVFISQGLHTVKHAALRILELGFGTGLNALLTLVESNTPDLEIYYHAVEKYPLNQLEFGRLNYEELVEGAPEGAFRLMHRCPWGEKVRITKRFVLYKEETDFRSMKLPPHFNLVYFDAFSPDKQPELWSQKTFSAIAEATDPGAVLVTYSSKGVVRRTLIACGFNVQKVPGPPGKREMIRAVRR